MRIVSLNLWGGRSCLEEIGQWLEETSADIYCFQEVFSSDMRDDSRIQDNDRAVHPNLLQHLKSLLPGYQSFFSVGSRGYINDGTWVREDIEYGITIFVRADWIVTSYFSDLVYGPFRYTSQGKPPLSRSAQVIRCLTPQGPIVLGNIHGLWEPEGKIDTMRRVDQAKNFNKMIEAISQQDDPIILCGDFNLLPQSETFDMLCDGKLRNLINEFQIQSTRTAHYKKDVLFADYILVSPECEVHAFFAPQFPLLSDHCPLIMDFNLCA